jgi:MFS family permease
MAALAVFTLASAACGAAPTSTLLVLGRLVQGLAGGALTPQISGLIQQLFSGEERGKAFGLFGTVVGISTAVGPLLGGLLIQLVGSDEGWRAVFYVNVPIGVVALILARLLLPPPGQRSDRRRHDFDPIGIALLGAAVVALMLPFVQEREWGAWKWLLLVLSGGLGAGLLRWERRYQRAGHEPVLDLRLFRRRSFSFGVGMITLYFAGFTPLFFVYTLFLQTGQHRSALVAGLAVTPFAVGSALTAAVGGRKSTQLGRPLVSAGLVCVALGFIGAIVAVHLASGPNAPWVVAGPLLLAGLGSGLVISPNQNLTLSEVPVEQAGTAGGLLQTGQRIGAAVGIAAVGAIFFAVATTPNDYARGFERGLAVAVAFVVIALAVTVVDVRVDRRRPTHLRGRPEHLRENAADRPAEVDS